MSFYNNEGMEKKNVCACRYSKNDFQFIKGIKVKEFQKKVKLKIIKLPEANLLQTKTLFITVTSVFFLFSFLFFIKFMLRVLYTNLKQIAQLQ